MKKILTTILILALVLLIGGATAEMYEVDGETITVDLDIGEVVVIGEDGQIYAYFATGEVYMGRVHILLCDGEIVDVISYTELVAPFAK